MHRRFVFIVAPTGRDGQLLSELLRRHDVVCEVFSSIRDLCRQIAEGAGVIVLTEEALAPGTFQELSCALDAQPPWSDIPMILLTSKSERLQSEVRAILQEKRKRSIVLMQRPVSRFDFLSAIETALQARIRQYEIRDYLEERARNEERLRHSQRLESIGSLAGGIAHDFNNLLTGVLGNASLAMDHVPQDSPARPMLRDVIKASEQAAHLTQQLLAYAGKGRFVIRRVDLSHLVEEVSTLVKSSIPRSVQLQLELPHRLPKIEADAAQLQQIVMNLVINGAEAIPPDRPGMVRVRTSVRDVDQAYLRTTFPGSEAVPGRYVALEVRDSGVGMDAATVERIFDPFFSTKFTGRGLGLAAVLGIVKGHRGALRIDSAPGQGTTFTVLFPAADSAPADLATAHEGNGAAQEAGTILVVDDEEFVRRVAKTALERLGYGVQVAEGGQAGVELFRQHHAEIALVLLDMTMPDLPGEDVFRQMREVRPDVRVVVSTGYDESETARHFRGMQLAGFIQKPYTPSRLGQIIRAALARD